MKWVWVLMIVGLVPMAAQAGGPTIAGEVHNIREAPNDEDGPHGFRFMIYADQATDRVRTSIRLYVDQQAPLHHVQTATCLFVINGKPVADMREYVSYRGQGHQLWFPRMARQELVTIGIVWKQHDPQIKYATIEVGNAQQQLRDWWTARGTQKHLDLLPVAERTQYYRELSLDDVCESFTMERLEGITIRTVK